MITLAPPPVTADAVDAAKTYLRIENDEEDSAIGALLAAAITHAEAFLNLIILRRSGTVIIPADSIWKRLPLTPVRAMSTVMGLPAEGAAFALPAANYALDIDANGDGWVRVMLPGGAGRVSLTIDVGLADSWDTVPEPIRLALLRLTAHLHAHRDNAEDKGPPAAVAALLRPWRRMKL